MTEAVLVTGGLDVQEHAGPGVGARLLRPVAGLLAIPRLLTWAGLLVSVVGLVLLVVAWGRTAALTSVALQVPYVVSAGFTGLALVAVGLTLVSIDAKHADARLRTHQLEEMRALVAELKAGLEADR